MDETPYNDIHNDRYKEESEGYQEETGYPQEAAPETGFQSAERGELKDNVIFVGIKPFMNYVTGVVMQFATKGAPEVVIKARGKFISRAVDIAEVALKRFLKDEILPGPIRINSEQFTNREGRDVRVSTIEITLIKK